jgi:hypothetical protein
MSRVAVADVQRFAWRLIAAQGPRRLPRRGGDMERFENRTIHTRTTRPARREDLRLPVTVKTPSRGLLITDRMTEASGQTKPIGADRRRLALGSDPGQLIDRIVTLRALLPAFAQEAADARREAARLRSQNAALQRRIVELEGRSVSTHDLTHRNA